VYLLLESRMTEYNIVSIVARGKQRCSILLWGRVNLIAAVNAARRFASSTALLTISNAAKPTRTIDDLR